jgi:exosome complex exonuclease DIS3/RRP44
MAISSFVLPSLIWIAIRQTLKFYPSHLQASTSNPPLLILLTDDRLNRQLATSEALTAVSTKQYVDGMQGEERERLVDLVVGGVDEIEPTEGRGGRRIYEEVSSGPQLFIGCRWRVQYLPLATLTAGVKTGRYHQGHFNANQYNYLEVCFILDTV